MDHRPMVTLLNCPKCHQVLDKVYILIGFHKTCLKNFPTSSHFYATYNFNRKTGPIKTFSF